MLQKVQRVTLTGSGFEEIAFAKEGIKFMVKNFTNGDIFVSFSEGATEDNSIKIPSGYYQLCVANEHGGSANAYNTDTLYIKGTGEVEVQELWFY